MSIDDNALRDYVRRMAGYTLSTAWLDYPHLVDGAFALLKELATKAVPDIPKDGPGSHRSDLAEMRAQTERAEKAERERDEARESLAGGRYNGMWMVLGCIGAWAHFEREQNRARDFFWKYDIMRSMIEAVEGLESDLAQRDRRIAELEAALTKAANGPHRYGNCPPGMKMLDCPACVAGAAIRPTSKANCDHCCGDLGDHEKGCPSISAQSPMTKCSSCDGTGFYCKQACGGEHYCRACNGTGAAVLSAPAQPATDDEQCFNGNHPSTNGRCDVDGGSKDAAPPSPAARVNDGYFTCPTCKGIGSHGAECQWLQEHYPAATLGDELRKHERYLNREISYDERHAPAAREATGFAGIFGKWPGDETDEQIEAALKDDSAVISSNRATGERLRALREVENVLLQMDSATSSYDAIIEVRKLMTIDAARSKP